MASKLSTIILIGIVLKIVHGDTNTQMDSQKCSEICSECGGEGTFNDDKCECNIGENYQSDKECLIRMKRDAANQGMDLFSCDTNNANRISRCLIVGKQRLNRDDIDRVASYFMNDGPIVGSPLKCNKEIIVQPEPKAEPWEHHNVNAPRVIVQPTYTYSDQSTQNECECSRDSLVGDINMENLRRFGIPVASISSGPSTSIVSQPAPSYNVPMVTNPSPKYPSLLDLLSMQMSRPLFGIPQTLEHLAETPFIKEIVGAPAMALKSMAASTPKPDEVLNKDCGPNVPTQNSFGSNNHMVVDLQASTYPHSNINFNSEAPNIPTAQPTLYNDGSQATSIPAARIAPIVGVQAPRITYLTSVPASLIISMLQNNMNSVPTNFLGARNFHLNTVFEPQQSFQVPNIPCIITEERDVYKRSSDTKSSKELIRKVRSIDQPMVNESKQSLVSTANPTILSIDKPEHLRHESEKSKNTQETTSNKQFTKTSEKYLALKGKFFKYFDKQLKYKKYA